MKSILVIYIITFILVMSIFVIDRFISYEPKGKFGKWWRKNLIQKSAFELGMRFDIIEKDIWVCYVLEKLFSIEEIHKDILEKLSL